MKISTLVVPPLSPKQIEALSNIHEDVMCLQYYMCLSVNCVGIHCTKCIYDFRQFRTFKIVARKHFLKGGTDEHI